MFLCDNAYLIFNYYPNTSESDSKNTDIINDGISTSLELLQ